MHSVLPSVRCYPGSLTFTAHCVVCVKSHIPAEFWTHADCNWIKALKKDQITVREFVTWKSHKLICWVQPITDFKENYSITLVHRQTEHQKHKPRMIKISNAQKVWALLQLMVEEWMNGSSLLKGVFCHNRLQDRCTFRVKAICYFSQSDKVSGGRKNAHIRMPTSDRFSTEGGGCTNGRERDVHRRSHASLTEREQTSINSAARQQRPRSCRWALRWDGLSVCSFCWILLIGSHCKMLSSTCSPIPCKKRGSTF